MLFLLAWPGLVPNTSTTYVLSSRVIFFLSYFYLPPFTHLKTPTPPRPPPQLP